MTKLNICDDILTITLYQEFLVFTLNAVQQFWEFKKVVSCCENIKKSNDAAIECCAFSPCAKYFGVCFDRNILIFDTREWSLLFSSLAERKACSLRFFPKSRLVLLADKSGTASFYSFQGNNLEKQQLVLGHNSMLTSALISQDEKFVITCDRDEKIRISNNPNVYNIRSYCLGHKMFVSCIDFLPSEKTILVSSSGDGTIRLWDFVLGKQLAMHNCNQANDSSESSKATIIKFVVCQQNNRSLIAALEYQSIKIRILSVDKDFCGDYKINLLDVLTLAAFPLDIAFQADTLVCLLPIKENPLIFWSYTESNIIKSNKCFKNMIQYFNDNWELFLETSSKISDSVPVLFKREMDNLQEYEQRKKARLLRTGKTC